ncbi:hypothetical protein B296_00048704, partial [Ensete ventricosum]
IGDETFIIAALMAMRHPKSIVLSGALMALLRMSQGFPIVEILVLLHFLSQSLLYVVSSASLSVLLAVSFQYYLLSQVLSTGLGRIVPNLISRKHTNSAATGKYFPLGVSLGWTADLMKTLITVLYAFFGLRLLYIAWRSDSKTSQKKEMEELATHKNAIGVAVGATLGHTICTSLAVVGGSMLASKISQKTVATIGGLLFLGFSLSSYFYPPL